MIIINSNDPNVRFEGKWVGFGYGKDVVLFVFYRHSRIIRNAYEIVRPEMSLVGIVGISRQRDDDEMYHVGTVRDEPNMMPNGSDQSVCANMIDGAEVFVAEFPSLNYVINFCEKALPDFKWRWFWPDDM